MKALNNDNGFVYPVVYIITTLFILFFVTTIGWAENHKKILYESEQMIQQEYYFMHTVKKVEQHLQEGKVITTTTLSFQHANIQYKVTSETKMEIKIMYHLTATGDYSVYGYSTYDKEKQKMTKWIEAVS